MVYANFRVNPGLFRACSPYKVISYNSLINALNVGSCWPQAESLVVFYLQEWAFNYSQLWGFPARHGRTQTRWMVYKSGKMPI